MVRLVMSVAFAALLLVLSCSASMVKTFEGQKLPREQTAKLFLQEKAGRRNLDSVMYCFVIEIDGENLAEKSGLYHFDDEGESYLTTTGMSPRLTRLMAGLDVSMRLRSYYLQPGNHKIAFQFAARNNKSGSATPFFVLTPAEMTFEAKPGHEYKPGFKCEGESYFAWIEDKNTGMVVGTNQPDLKESFEN